MNMHNIFNKFSGTIYTLIILLFVGISNAQSQGCVNPDTVASYPFPSAQSLSGATVYYHYENIPDGPEKSQIQTAISNWNNSLYNSCSDVQFVLGPPIGAAPSLTIRNGDLLPGRVGLTDVDLHYGNEAQEVTITINPFAEAGGVRYFNAFVHPVSFLTAYEKVAMHEIGHALGLNHYTTLHPDTCRNSTPANSNDDQIQGSSVMNGGCEINDSANNQSTTVTDCDYAQLNSIYCLPATPNSLSS